MDFDVVISGAGLVGATLACSLKPNLKIAVIDKAGPLSSSEKKARALALSPPSVMCLETLGVWPKVSDKAVPILSIQVSKKNHFGTTQIVASDYALSALGQVVDSAQLGYALQRALSDLPHVQTFYETEIKTLSKEGEGWSVQLSSGDFLKASLMVGAEGTHSSLREAVGIGAVQIDPAQSALVVNGTFSKPHGGMAFERFTEEGSLALIPLPDSEVKCVWIVPTSRMHTLQALPDAVLIEKIQENFGFRLGKLLKVQARLIYPLRTLAAETVYIEGLALIGNAANSLHPIAAQGFNLGLRDAAFLAEKIAEGSARGDALGSLAVLKDYAKARVQDHEVTYQGTQRLLKPNAFLQASLWACEYFPFVKNKLVEWGTGCHTPLPKLCRGIAL